MEDSPDDNPSSEDAYRVVGLDSIIDTMTGGKFVPPSKLRAMMYVLGYSVAQEDMAHLLDPYLKSAYDRTLAELYHREFPHGIVWDYELIAPDKQIQLENTDGDGDFFDIVDVMEQELKDMIRTDTETGRMPVARASWELARAGFYTQRPLPQGANIFEHATDTLLSPYQVLAFCKCEPQPASALFGEFVNIRPNQKLMLFTDGPSDQPAIERQLVSDSLKAQYIPFIIPTMVHTDRDLYSSLVAQFKQRTGCADSVSFIKKYVSGATPAQVSVHPPALFGEGNYADPNNGFALAEFFVQVKNYWGNAVFFVSADTQVPEGLREQKSIIYLADSRKPGKEDSFATKYTYVQDAKILKITPANEQFRTIDPVLERNRTSDIAFHREAYGELEEKLLRLARVAKYLPDGDNCLGRVTRGFTEAAGATQFVEIETVFDEGSVKRTNPTKIRYLYDRDGKFLRIEYFVYKTRNWLEKPKQGDIVGEFSDAPVFFAEQRWFHDLPEVIKHMSKLRAFSKREAKLFATMQSVTKTLEQSPKVQADPRFAKAAAALSGFADYMVRVGERRDTSRFTLGPVASDRLVKRFETGNKSRKFFFYVTQDAATVKEQEKEFSAPPPFQVMVYEKGLSRRPSSQTTSVPNKKISPLVYQTPTELFEGEFKAGNDQACYPCDYLYISVAPDGVVAVHMMVDTQFFQLNLHNGAPIEPAPWRYIDTKHIIPPLEFDPVDFLTFFSELVNQGFEGRPLREERRPSAAAAFYHVIPPEAEAPSSYASAEFTEPPESYQSDMLTEALYDTTTYFGAQCKEKLNLEATPSSTSTIQVHKAGMNRLNIQLTLTKDGMNVALV